MTTIDHSSKPQVRQVCFWLFRGDTKLVEGAFTVTREPEVSCFGTYRDVETNGAPPSPVAIFEGAVIEHQLDDDGTASIQFTYYSATPNEESPIGFSQRREVKAGLSMGSQSGADDVESVMLGHEHEFVFRTHVVA